ncbi:MAG: hypothetical protein AAFY48_17185 [Bacteroidota bacterium]
MKEIDRAKVRKLRARAHDISVNSKPTTTAALMKLIKLTLAVIKEREEEP